MSQTLRINEVFYSIQGESTRAGEPCVFVRLSGCHLRCTYCDTAYAFREGAARTIADLVERVCSFPCDLVEVTGGEPLLQRRVFPFMAQLCERGKTVLVETSGACDISGESVGENCDERVIRIMDLKTPGSGECERNDWANIPRLRAHDEIKFVICDRADYDWALSTLREHHLADRVHAVLMSPVFSQAAGNEIAGHTGLSMRELAEWMLADGLGRAGVRLQSQLHKFIWDPQTRGV